MLTPFTSLVRHPSLIWQFARRDILGRYRGSLLGLSWAVISPLMMLLVYTFVFVGVFKARWPGAGEHGGAAFALQIFAGLAVFNFFSEVLNRTPHLIVEQPHLVKKVTFPLEILPFVAVLAGLFHLLLNALILLAGSRMIFGPLPSSALALPLIWLPMIPLMLGLGWFFSALGVFVRDIAQIMGMALNLLLFLSPIFYSASSVPEEVRFWMHLNPLTLMIENTRHALFTGQLPDWSSWLAYLALSCGVALLGAYFFQSTRQGFADVL